MLSATSLSQHNQAQSPNTNNAKTLIKQEAAQRYQRAVFGTIQDEVNGGPTNEPRTVEEIIEEMDGLEKLDLVNHPSIQVGEWTPIKMYGAAEPSGASPLDRLHFVSPYDDPMPLLARRTLNRGGVTTGAMEDVEIRSNAATAVVEIKVNEVYRPESEATHTGRENDPGDTRRQGSSRRR